MEDKLNDRLLLKLYEHDLELLRIQSTKDYKIYTINPEIGSPDGYRYYEPKKYLEVGSLKKNLVKYYNDMSEEGKLYVAVTYGIPE